MISLKKAFILGLFFAVLSEAKVSALEQLGGEHFYIAQEAQGEAMGASCAHAYGMEWTQTYQNSLDHWGEGEKRIGPGDTVHLCYTLTTPFVVYSSGAPERYLTILFEPGAKMSQEVWGPGGAIYAPSKSWLVIDGGTNINGTPIGLIENTDNGTGGIKSFFLSRKYNWPVLEPELLRRGYLTFNAALLFHYPNPQFTAFDDDFKAWYSTNLTSTLR